MALRGRQVFQVGQLVDSDDLNAIAAQTTQVFASSSARTTAYGGTTPDTGEISYLTNTAKRYIYRSGSWQELLPPEGDTGDLDASGGFGPIPARPTEPGSYSCHTLADVSEAIAAGLWPGAAYALPGTAGVVTTHDGHRVHAWETAGDYTLTVTRPFRCQIVAVGAGGGGVNSSTSAGQGGGAGGVRNVVADFEPGDVLAFTIGELGPVAQFGRRTKVTKNGRQLTFAMGGGAPNYGIGGSITTNGLRFFAASPGGDSYPRIADFFDQFQGHAGSSDVSLWAGSGGGYGSAAPQGSAGGGDGYALPWWSPALMLAVGGPGGGDGSTSRPSSSQTPGSGGGGSDDNNITNDKDGESGQEGAVYVRYALPVRGV